MISSRRRLWAGSGAVFVVVAVAYILYAQWQWHQWTARSWDLSIFTQLLQRYSHLQAPIVTVKGDNVNLLGDHFHPLLAVLAPIFAIFPHAFTLLVIQALCFAVAAGVFAWCAQRRLGAPTGILLGLAFGLSWGLQSAAEAQFHEIALAVPLLTASLVAILDRRWRAAAVWAAPLVFVKEDLGLTVVAIGLVIVFLSRTRVGLWLAVWGIGWFAVATFVVLPLLSPSGSWAYIGSANPISVFSDLGALFNPSKGETLLLLFVATGGLVLRSPLSVILVPTLAWRFLSTNYGYWGPTWHYSAVLMPIIFAALLDAIDRGPQARWAWLRQYSTHGAAIAITVAVMLMPTLPLRVLTDPGSWATPPRAASAQAALAAIPTGARVETDLGLMTYLVDDHLISWIGGTSVIPDCIAIDTQGGGTPAEWGDVVAVAERLHPSAHFTRVFAGDGYDVACRRP